MPESAVSAKGTCWAAFSTGDCAATGTRPQVDLLHIFECPEFAASSNATPVVKCLVTCVGDVYQLWDLALCSGYPFSNVWQALLRENRE